MEQIYSDEVTGQSDSIQNVQYPLIKKVLVCMSSAHYELAMNIVGILNVFSLLVTQLNQGSSSGTKYLTNWMIVQMIINYCFLLEMICDLIVSGPIGAYTHHFRIWPETLCQALNLAGTVLYADSRADNLELMVKVFEMVIFIRMTKLLTLLYEVKVMRIIIETLRNLLGPLNNLIIVMLTIFYEFAMIGSALFGGKVQTTSPAILHDSSIPDNYQLINFNDLVSSFVTLFILIVVNNWFVVVQMFVDVCGGVKLYRFYFIVFYYFGVIIGLNIVVAFAIDMYSAVERLDAVKEENERFLLELADKKNTMSTFEKKEIVKQSE